MKKFQGYAPFITSTGSGIELDVAQALLVEVADVTPVNVAEDTLKAHMDDLANGSKKITNSIYHIADATIIQEATQQNIDRFRNEQIDYEFAGISASVQCPRWVRTYIYESCDSDPHFYRNPASEKIRSVRQAEFSQVIESSTDPVEAVDQVPSAVRFRWAHSFTHLETEAITKFQFCEIRSAFGGIEG